ncbi:MAG: LptF/LptG family permease [Pirellulales bacterium]
MFVPFTRIDRYLLFLYFRVLVICFASISGLLIVIHIFSNLDSFSKHSSETQLSLWTVLTEYYGPYTLSIFERLSGLLALLAVLFTLGWLYKTNELTALLAAGINKQRVLRPLWMASGIVIFTAVMAREVVIPPFQDSLDRSPQDLTGTYPRPIRPAYDPDSHALIQGKHLLPLNKSIVEMQVKMRGGPMVAAVGNKIIANLGTYQSADQNHPAGYLMSGVTIPRNIDKRASVQEPETKQYLIMTPADFPWLESGSCFLPSSIEYENLRGGSAWKQFASTTELITQLKSEKSPSSGDDLRLSIHQRLVRPLVDMAVLLLGVPILLSRPDRHMFWLAGVSLAVVGGFTAVSMGLAALGTSGYLITPHLATWLPLIIFLPFGWSKTCLAMNT